MSLELTEQSKRLGKGAFGIVYEGMWNGNQVAIKRIDKIEFLLPSPQSAEQRGEEDIMKNLNHSNVLKLFHVESDNNFKYFCLELCEATIYDYCHGKYKGSVPSEDNSLHQMASGLAYIHTQGLAHRDIKEDNVLIFKSIEGIILKVSDFGLSKPISASGNYSLRSGVKGTYNYLSPELLRLAEQEQNPNSFNLRMNVSSDVFALGCLFHSFLTKGKHPFAHSRGTYCIPINIAKGKFNIESISDDIHREIIRGMIDADPEKRTNLQIVRDMLHPRL